MRRALFEKQETRNVILGALSHEEEARLAPHLRPREFALADELATPGQETREVYFLERGLLSSIIQSNQNVGVEVSAVGREGVWSALLALNGCPRVDHVIAQVAGWGWSLPVPILRQEFACGGTLQSKLLCFFDLQYTEAAITGVCNRLHTLEERLARWLLIMRRAAESDTFEMPLEFVACMLGSRLSGVPIALGVLQRAGMIALDGPTVHILNVPAIEGIACECHALLNERLELYLGCGQSPSSSSPHA